MSKRQTHEALELRMEWKSNRQPSVVYCAEVRFGGGDCVISVQDDGEETMHTRVRSMSVKLGRSL